MKREMPYLTPEAKIAHLTILIQRRPALLSGSSLVLVAFIFTSQVRFVVEIARVVPKMICASAKSASECA